jgi:hypothetical protein
MTARLAPHSSTPHAATLVVVAAAAAATRERALALLNEAHLGVEYALLLCLSKDEAAAFLAAAAGLEPELTLLGARTPRRGAPARGLPSGRLTFMP